MKKICFIASSGGHFEQLMMLKPLINSYDSFIITEKTRYCSESNDIYYLQQLNRKDPKFIFIFIKNIYISFKLFKKYKPDIIISTGVLSAIPMLFIGKLFKKKIIYIESFAKINSPTLTGKIIYKIADQFYVQWEEMLKVYPKAIYMGGIY